MHDPSPISLYRKDRSSTPNLAIYSAAFGSAGASGSAASLASAGAALGSAAAGSASDEVQRVYEKSRVSMEVLKIRAIMRKFTKLSLRSCMIKVESL